MWLSVINSPGSNTAIPGGHSAIISAEILPIACDFGMVSFAE